ncbi:Flp family type IVb pilin [Trinickia dinghuensis]|uniref:Flp family type IVb pilin n=1 Tax=Trinickia dinghuensis TaxID=2291023 RepID=A0A3D8K200_9BURK|nr:Flp family type IVb pilin [Trinickia dinghuensis]RDU98601.1 Flp family type IVb pilin [Trinickia dinghuensis]
MQTNFKVAASWSLAKRTNLLSERSFVLPPNNHEVSGNVPRELTVNTNVFFGCPVVRDLAHPARRSRAAGKAKAFLHDDCGATMVEYAFMVMLIAIVCVATVSTIGTKLNTVYNIVASDF